AQSISLACSLSLHDALPIFLLGWLPDYSGTISIDGRDMRNFTPAQIQRQMSYISQDVYLFNTTIRENITMGDVFSDEEMQQALRSEEHTSELQSRFDLVCRL